MVFQHICKYFMRYYENLRFVYNQLVILDAIEIKTFYKLNAYIVYTILLDKKSLQLVCWGR